MAEMLRKPPYKAPRFSLIESGVQARFVGCLPPGIRISFTMLKKQNKKTSPVAATILLSLTNFEMNKDPLCLCQKKALSCFLVWSVFNVRRKTDFSFLSRFT